MKFELTAQQSESPSGGPDGNFDVMPEAVHAILVDVQTAAFEFEELLAGAETAAISLAEECKAPPISRELSTFYTFLLAKRIKSAEGRIAVASVGCHYSGDWAPTSSHAGLLKHHLVRQSTPQCRRRTC